uniref:STI1 domain-containing protein n=1 Tax=Polyblepharides amylifera TaxID=1486889 RepID=A0A7R9XLY5_9CHLO|mmetsp:Transcript_1213/g.1720  ORF Transcript_1213/g.1720 Transcript_1213/m.1720 type:complete len:564 (+) Transcript_1213:119-1810(+)|eukprot:CAMPEP_0196579124 /NCGR_PEP_ID=MMETSP1081-20130531/17661_1 /TAXON_ID=36882 /ORGANISM="Pyramimonas amylifera, Strain CCMP720" /LENGTH=563 /DNA_ID=CAMNT_0041898593 /DNA_START=115 /DNA_END=1806 /DNA_ORIENTATION=+
MSADELKSKGNAAFSAGRFEEAIEHFSAAIELDASNHVLFSNRSAAQASLKNFQAALDDAKKTTSLKPDWPKGFSRLGAAFYGLGELDKSVSAYNEGLAIDPENAQLVSGLQEVQQAKSRGSSGGGPLGGLGNMFSGADIWAKLAANPNTRAYLQQPDFVQMINNVQANPGLVSNYLQDPRMMQVMGALLGVNMQSGDEFMKNNKSNAAAPSEPEPVPEPEPEPMDDEEKEKKKEKEEAQKEKELGNAAYKKKDFEEAIKHYNTAITLDDSDISFLTNRAAVHLEMGSWELCMKDCDTAVEKGREIRADYKMIARALARKGLALEKSGDLPGAISFYNHALTEHRSADTLAKLKAAEATLKKQQEEEYLDDGLAEVEKDKGNEFFRSGDFPSAVKHYSESLKRNPKDHKVYSNRAACYMKLAAFMEAQKDAEKCIEIDPTFPKGYTRKGAVQFFMKEYSKAIETYQLGLKHDPENQELKEGIARCVDMINKGNRGELSEEEMKARQEKGMADPEIQTILSDPVMRQVLSDMQENPKAAQEHMKNPMVMGKIQKLVNAGILQIR